MILGSKKFIRESLEKIKKESISKHETSRKRLLVAPPPDIQEIISSLALKASCPGRDYHLFATLPALCDLSPAKTYCPVEQ